MKKRLNSISLGVLGLSGLSAGFTPSPVLAQNTNTDSTSRATSVLEEIIITAARRRDEDVQVTPVAVSAFSGRLLEQQRILSTAELGKLAPNLQTFKQLATADMAGMYLRGFGVATDDPSVDPPIAIYIDGSYQPHVMGTMIDLFDVESVEVLRGPQGTLFGKNAPSGAVNIRSKRPTGELGGKVQVDLGRFDRQEIRARVDFPIIEDVLAGKAYIIDKDGGDYIKNRTLNEDWGGDDITAGRVGFLFTPNDDFEWYVTASYSKNQSPQHGIRNQTDASTDPEFVPAVQLVCLAPDILGGAPLADPADGYCDPSSNPRYTTDSGLDFDQDIEVLDFSSEINWTFDPVTLTAVTSVRDYDGTTYQDADGEPAQLLEAHGQRLQYDTFSQELRLASSPGGGLDFGGKVDWVTGVYYFTEDYDYFRPLVVLYGPVLQLQEGEVDSRAVFGHATYHLTDNLSASFGARKTWDEKDHAYNVGMNLIPESDEWSNTSFEGSVKYTIDDDKMVYLRVAEAYRGGGFTGNPPSPAFAESYDPEEAISYEIGGKIDWLDNTVRTNIAIFHSEYDDLQRSVVKAANEPPFFALTIQNAAQGTVDGVELENLWTPIPELTIKLNIAYLNPKYDDFFGDPVGVGVEADHSDWEWGYAPQWSGLLGAEYVAMTDMGSLTFSADYSYRDEMYAQDLPAPRSLVDSLGLVSASVTFETLDERYMVRLYGTNLTDEWYTDSITTNAPFFTQFNDAPPRQWGIALSASF